MAVYDSPAVFLTAAAHLEAILVAAHNRIEERQRKAAFDARLCTAHCDQVRLSLVPALDDMMILLVVLLCGISSTAPRIKALVNPTSALCFLTKGVAGESL